MTSGALWVVLLWIVFVVSRPLSLWFGVGTEVGNSEAYLEGNPLNRGVFLVLIVGALLVLFRRRVDWRAIYASNAWFFAFILYCGISVIWSDYPFVGFKRWMKELGNVSMIFIMMTEIDPVQATKAVFARFVYFVIPLSVVFIKYFPEFGTYYNPWTWERVNCGVTTNKNELGAALFVCSLYLVWDFMEMRSIGSKTDKWDFLSRFVLVLMLLWLISVTQSSTSLVCIIVGISILLFMRRPFARRQVKYLGTYGFMVGSLMLLIYSVPAIQELLVGIVGRDSTLTGRTDLWADLLREPINPLLGAGYNSFWLGTRAEELWEKYSFHPIQAHNGYLEMYLNGGLIGVFLLMSTIISTGRKLKKGLMLGSSYGALLFSFFVCAVLYNWTEAMFSCLSIVWIILLIAIVNYPSQLRSMPE